MLSITTIYVLYACILFSGAYFGLKAGSKISLIMGISSGIFVLLATFITTTDRAAGFAFLSVISGLLTVIFLIRLMKTGKFMPAGMLLIINAGMLILSVCQLLGIS